ncbi:MAG: response regulator, partial [Maribacter sp.]|nr:response regulator [Maribacter sp.]
MKKKSSEKNQGDFLVISSDNILKSDIALFLEPSDYHIKYINEGEIILEKIDEEQPDLILLDTNWHIGDSYGLCHKLKTNKFSKNIPIILFGDFKEEDKLSSCLGKDANDFIATPLKKLELLTRVKMQLALYFANRDNQRLVLNEAYHTAAIKVIKEGFVVHDKSDKIVSANEAAANILGLTYNQLLGKDSFDPRWKALHEDGSPFTPEEHPSMISLRKCISVNDVIMN